MILLFLQFSTIRAYQKLNRFHLQSITSQTGDLAFYLAPILMYPPTMGGVNTSFCDPHKNPFFENTLALASSFEFTKLLRNTRKTIHASNMSIREFKIA